ncbi:hypothetical protein BD626DRAFT_105866 [Schizophyllum amplum]|uniref:RapZ C-terminal domain-containing protein n=1 Tax=Schizophyllum amplum TaxID=97359 RepID=A0A550CSL3_9AGAR|nr:hypothetical protein BD626DRAFT_105866 [Auriculariopsis ampla]
MIILDGMPLTPGAALDPLDTAFAPLPRRPSYLDRPSPASEHPPHHVTTTKSPLPTIHHPLPPCNHTLRLTTYGFERGPPAGPAPALTFDIRDLPNPPKPVREAHLGTSEVMQQCLFEDEGVRARFAEVIDEVEEVVRKHQTKDHRPREQPDEDALTIAVCCRKGKHRSVAFVERLARELRAYLASVSWGGDWRVEVVHRDVNAPKSRPTTASPQEKHATPNAEVHGDPGLKDDVSRTANGCC